MKKKIAIVINSLQAGGCERYVANLINQLSDEVDWVLITFRDETHYSISGLVKKYLIDIERESWSRIFYFYMLPRAAHKLRLILKDEGVSTVVAFNHLPSALCILLRFQGWRGKLVLTEQVHCSTFLSHIRNPLRRYLKRQIIRYGYLRADLVICNSGGILRDLKENFGLTHVPMKVVPSMVDMHDIKLKMSEPLPDRYRDILKGKYVFAHLGRFEGQKNHQLLVTAFEKVCLNDSLLLLIGSGSLMPAIKALVSERGLSEKVVFVGLQENPFCFLAASNAFVLSSDFEGFPNVVLEAMACGLPIISTNCPTGPAEVLLGDGEDSAKLSTIHVGAYGMLVPVENADALATAMKQLHDDLELQSHLRAVAIERVGHFAADYLSYRFLDFVDGAEGRAE